MAALYLHNAIWSPEQPDDGASSAKSTTTTTTTTNIMGKHRPPQRPRRMRSLSFGGTMLRTVSPDGSHPTEPLLRAGTSESIAYRDLLSRQPAHPDGPQAAWDVGLSFEGDLPTAQERKLYRERSLRRRIRRYRLGKAILEVVFGVWTLYNVVRYFIAYNLYASSLGQAAALALGTSSTLALAFLLSAALISVFRHYLLMHYIPIDSILTARTVLQWLLSVFLLAPAFANFVLVFAWSNSPDDELRFKTRCWLDLDVVWAVRSGDSCTRSSRWGAWFTLSFVRFLMTFADLMLYHFISQAYYTLRRPSWSRKLLHLRSKTRPPRESFRLSSPFQQLSGCQTAAPFVSSPPSTLPRYPVSTVRSNNSNHSTHHSRSGGSRTLTNNSPSLTDKELPPTPEYDPYANFDPSNPFGADEVDEWAQQRGNGGGGGDRELKGFVDHFKSIVEQIVRDTQQGMLGRSEDASSSSSLSLSTPSSPSSTVSAGSSSYAGPRTPGGRYNKNNNNTNTNAGGLFNPYDGYGGPPPVERVRMLGQYVRRMPTIESLGSREAHSSVHRGEAPGSPTTVGSGRGVSVYSTVSSSEASSSRLSAYYTNVGHAPSSSVVLVPARESAEEEGGGTTTTTTTPSSSFHTAVSGGETTADSGRLLLPTPPPPPPPPKEPADGS